MDSSTTNTKQEQIKIRVDDEIKELQRQRAYLSAHLEEATKELARLDLLNLTLTQQKRQAIAAFNFIKIMQEKIEKALTIDDLCSSVVKAVTSDMFMDSSALLRINYKTRDASILASVGLPENTKGFKLYESISKQEVPKPTFVNSKSHLKPFHMFVRNSFKIPYFVWYPVADEEDGILVLFAGNRFEDLVSKQPLSEASLETFGAISSVILLRRNNIVNVQKILRAKEERIDFLAEILKTSPISVIATDKDAKITYSNPAAEKLYGYSAEELKGKEPILLNAEPNGAEIEREILDTVRQGKIWKGEIRNRKKNGDLFYIHASIYQLLDKEGNFLALVGFQRDITERKHAEEKLKRSREQLRALTARLAEVEEAERRRLAQELHDQLGQNLTALGINLNILRNQLPAESEGEIDSRLNDSLNLVEEAVKRIRSLTADLRPAVLDDYGLLAAIRWYSKQFSNRTGLTTIVRGGELTPRLLPSVEITMFRIVQEALTNVAKHAQASKVTITLGEVDGMVRLTIADDGRGFDTTGIHQLRAQSGWGLITMKERAEAIGGYMRVESEPGKGTKVFIEVGR